MHDGDIQTIVLKKRTDGVWGPKTIEVEWLRFMGFSEKELAGDEVELVAQGDFSRKYKQPFIGIAKKR